MLDSVVCIGHNRYSTAGKKGTTKCIQPYDMETLAGWIAVAHNGEVVNAPEKRSEVQ